MIKTKTKKRLERALSCVLAFVMTASMSTVLPVAAEEVERYPYVILATDKNTGITVDADGFTLNGNAHSNGEFSVTSSYSNINGKITDIDDVEETEEFDVSSDMIFMHNKLTTRYFTDNCLTFDESYTYTDNNVNVHNPIYVTGELNLEGNVTLNNAIGAVSDIELSDGNLNGNNTVIYSKFGDIDISGGQASVNGLIYAPFGTVTIDSDNFNLNGVIIAQSVVISCEGNVNINYNYGVGEMIGVESEELSLDEADIPYLEDTDSDELFDVFEIIIGTDKTDPDTDGDKLTDGYEVLYLGTDPTVVDSDENGVSDADEDFDEDGFTNIQEIEQGRDPYCDESIANMVFEMDEDGTITESTLEEKEDINTSLQTPVLYASYASNQADILLKIMSLNEFKSESKKIMQNLDIFFGNYYDDIEHSTLYTDSKTSFIQNWNNAASSGKKYDVCVINCHATPNKLCNKTETSNITINDIKKLKTLDCECLILLGCNAAHYDLIWQNVAFEFSKKVTGVVVASDGTVVSKEMYGYLQTFKSIMDEHYYDYTDTRKNYGWVIYSYNPQKLTTTWYSTGYKKIAMVTIINHLEKSGLVDF